MTSRFRALAIAAAMTAVSSPLAAQSLGSDGDKFLSALKSGDNGEALGLIENPGATVVNYRDGDGDTGLHIVTRARKSVWVGYLLSKGADPDIGDSNGDTPLILAARIGYMDGATRLLSGGALVDKGNRLGETPLIVAVQQRQPAIVRLLLEAGANPDKADYAAGYSARDYARRDNRSPEMLRLIETVKSKKKAAVGPVR